MAESKQLKQFYDMGFEEPTYIINKKYGIRVDVGKDYGDDWCVQICPKLAFEKVKQVNIRNANNPNYKTMTNWDEQVKRDGMIYFSISKKTALYVIGEWISFAKQIGFSR